MKYPLTIEQKYAKLIRYYENNYRCLLPVCMRAKIFKFFMKQIKLARKNEKAKIIPRLHSIQANIPVTWGMGARNMVGKLIKELEK